MKKQILILLFSISFVLTYSQNSEFSYPNFIGKDLDSIENDLDWKVLQKAFGDLNNDGLEDFSIILEAKDSVGKRRCPDCKILKNKPRIILVLFDQNGEETVIIQNNKFIARGDEGGMLPYLEPELSIKNGLLIIYYQYTRGNQSYAFEFKNNQMEIISAESNDVESASGNFESNKYDFNKGEITTTTGNISDEKNKNELIKIDVRPKSLSEFEEMYEWEIAENKYL